jgi:hypothetical protein
MGSVTSMRDCLSRLDVAIWLILIACKVFLCLCALRKHVFRRVPWFYTYIFTSAIKSIFLFITAMWASYTAYYYCFYVSGYIETVLALCTLIESGRRVLPGLDLPQREKAFSFLLAAFVGIAVFVSTWPMRSIGKRCELAAYFVVAATFIFIAVYSRYLGLYWSRLVAGISANMGLLYLVDAVAKAMLGHFPASLVLHVRQLSQIANVLAVIIWIVVILSPWGERKLTEEGLRKIEAALATIEASLHTARIKSS